MKQTVAIVNGILGEQPASSRDADVDGATRAYFAATSPKSLARERVPKQATDPDADADSKAAEFATAE